MITMILLGLLVLAVLLLGIVIGLGVGYAIAVKHAARVTRRQDVRPVAPAAAAAERMATHYASPAQPATARPVISEREFDAHLVDVVGRSGNAVFKLGPKDAYVVPAPKAGRPC